jgi:hypothetical protein
MPEINLNGFIWNDSTFTESNVTFLFKITDDGKRIFTINNNVQSSGAWLVASQNQVFYLVYIQEQNTLYSVTARKIELFKSSEQPTYSLKYQILNPKTGFRTPCQPDEIARQYLLQRLGAGNANDQSLYDEQQTAESKVEILFNSNPATDEIPKTDFFEYFQKAHDASRELYIQEQKKLPEEHITFAVNIFPWFKDVIHPLCLKIENQEQLVNALEKILQSVNPDEKELLYAEISYINQQFSSRVLKQIAIMLETKSKADKVAYSGGGDSLEGSITVALSAERIYYFCLDLLFATLKILYKELEPAKSIQFIAKGNDIDAFSAEVVHIAYASFVSNDNVKPIEQKNDKNFTAQELMLLEILHDYCDFDRLDESVQEQFNLLSGKISALFANPDNLVLNEFIACLAGEGETEHSIEYLKNKIKTQANRIWAPHRKKFKAFYESDAINYEALDFEEIDEEDLQLITLNLSDQKRTYLFNFFKKQTKWYFAELRLVTQILKVFAPNRDHYFSSIFGSYFSQANFSLIKQAAQIDSYDELLLQANSIEQEKKLDLFYIASDFVETLQDIIGILPLFSFEDQYEIILFEQDKIKTLSWLIIISAKLPEKQRVKFLKQFDFKQIAGYEPEELKTIKKILVTSNYLLLVAYLHSRTNGIKEIYQPNMLKFITELDTYQTLTVSSKLDYLTGSLSTYEQLCILLPYLPEDGVMSALKNHEALVSNGFKLLTILKENIYDGKYNGRIALEFKSRISRYVIMYFDENAGVSQNLNDADLADIVLQINDDGEKIALMKDCVHLVKNLQDLNSLLGDLRRSSMTHDITLENRNFLNEVALCFKDKIETDFHLIHISKYFDILYCPDAEKEYATIPSVITEKLSLISTVEQLLEVINCTAKKYRPKMIHQCINLFSTIENVDLFFENGSIFDAVDKMMIPFIINFHSAYKRDIVKYSMVMCRVFKKLNSGTYGPIPAMAICCFLAIHDFEFLKNLSSANLLDQGMSETVNDIINNVEMAEKKLKVRAFPDRLHKSDSDKMDLWNFEMAAYNFLKKPSPQLSRLLVWLYDRNHPAQVSPIKKYVALCNAHDQLVHYFSEQEIKAEAVENRGQFSM